MAGGGCFLVIGLLGLVFSRGSRSERKPAHTPPAGGPFEVRRISIAFDWTERRELQAALEGLAGRHDMSTEQGMLLVARATRDLLHSAIDAARYASFARFHLGASEAESRFQGLAIGLRSRFTEETVDNARRAIATAKVARADEGEGLVVISIVLGTTHHLPEVPPSLGRAEVDRMLGQSIPAAGADLVAFEVIWSPSEENDRMSSAELEVLYPELARLDDDRAIGRIACGYCCAPYPAELGQCPSCGAPRRG